MSLYLEIWKLYPYLCTSILNNRIVFIKMKSREQALWRFGNLPKPLLGAGAKSCQIIFWKNKNKLNHVLLPTSHFGKCFFFIYNERSSSLLLLLLLLLLISLLFFRINTSSFRKYLCFWQVVKTYSHLAKSLFNLC